MHPCGPLAFSGNIANHSDDLHPSIGTLVADGVKLHISVATKPGQQQLISTPFPFASA